MFEFLEFVVSSFVYPRFVMSSILVFRVCYSTFPKATLKKVSQDSERVVYSGSHMYLTMMDSPLGPRTWGKLSVYHLFQGDMLIPKARYEILPCHTGLNVLRKVKMNH